MPKKAAKKAEKKTETEISNEKLSKIIIDTFNPMKPDGTLENEIPEQDFVVDKRKYKYKFFHDDGLIVAKS